MFGLGIPKDDMERLEYYRERGYIIEEETDVYAGEAGDISVNYKIYDKDGNYVETIYDVQ